MTSTEFFALLETIPTWGWVVGALVVLIVFTGERILWEFEVKFPGKEGVGRGKIEIKKGKKRGIRMRCSFELEPEFNKKSIEVQVNGREVITIPAENNVAGRFLVRRSLSAADFHEGEEVTVLVDRAIIFSGPLVRD